MSTVALPDWLANVNFLNLFILEINSSIIQLPRSLSNNFVYIYYLISSVLRNEKIEKTYKNKMFKLTEMYTLKQFK